MTVLATFARLCTDDLDRAIGALVASGVGDQLTAALAAGALVVREPAEQATGRDATVRFGEAGGGWVIEYVEWNADTRTG